MARIWFNDVDGTVIETQAPVGHTVMEAARDANVPGLPADCGGACACATCHVYIDPDWYERVGAPSELEANMLECAESPSQYSRLSCQISVTDDLDGLVCRVPRA